MLRSLIKGGSMPIYNHQTKRTFMAGWLLYGLEYFDHKRSRVNDLELSIKDVNVNAVRGLVAQNKYTKSYVSSLIPSVNTQIKTLEADLKMPIKNVGGIVLGVGVAGVLAILDLINIISGITFILPCFMFSVWSVPKQKKLLQYNEIKQTLEHEKYV